LVEFVIRTGRHVVVLGFPSCGTHCVGKRAARGWNVVALSASLIGRLILRRRSEGLCVGKVEAMVRQGLAL
jgi:hypothetical protein